MFGNPTDQMTPTQVISQLGGTQEKAAKALGVRQSAISQWLVRGFVPLTRQYQVQVITGGQLQANPNSVPKHGQLGTRRKAVHQ